MCTGSILSGPVEDKMDFKWSLCQPNCLHASKAKYFIEIICRHLIFFWLMCFNV